MTTLKAIKMFGVFPGQWLRETMKIALKLTPMRHGENRYSLLRGGLAFNFNHPKTHLLLHAGFNRRFPNVPYQRLGSALTKKVGQIHQNRPQQTHDPTADNISTADTALASAMDNFGLNEKVP
jgi:hypothetical protein